MEIKQQIEVVGNMLTEELEEATRVIVRQREAINAADGKMVSITNLEMEMLIGNIKRHVAKFPLLIEAAERDIQRKYESA